jgi:hypothetical protein
MKQISVMSSITFVIYRDLHMSFLENAGTSAKKRTVNIWGSVTSVDDQALQNLLCTIVVMYFFYSNIKNTAFSHTTCVYVRYVSYRRLSLLP